MINLNIRLVGGDEFAKVLKEAPRITSPILADALNESAFVIQRNAKLNAPVRTSLLRGSINVQEASAITENLKAIVGTNLKYAPYQEFGTGIYAGHPPITPKRAKVLRFKTRGGKIVFARSVKGTKPIKYMQNAIEKSQGFYQQAMDRALEKIVFILATK